VSSDVSERIANSMLVDADVLQFPVVELTQHDQCRFAFVARDHARDPTVDKAA
jgi:hypothetical protein